MLGGPWLATALEGVAFGDGVPKSRQVGADDAKPHRRSGVTQRSIWLRQKYARLSVIGRAGHPGVVSAFVSEVLASQGVGTRTNGRVPDCS
jgi:hypothetical protein